MLRFRTEEKNMIRTEERVSTRLEVMEVMRKKRKFQQTRQKEYEAEKERLRKKHAEKHPDPQVIPFIEKPFGLSFDEKLFLIRSVVSIGLFNGKVMVYACSGTAVQYYNKNIQQHNTVFVTTKCLAESFEKNRTTDDNLKVRVRLPDNTIISDFLGLYDDNIAIVTAFTRAHVYPASTKPVDQQRNTDVANLYAVGRTYRGDLMGTICSSLDCSEAIVSPIPTTQVGLGGPVIVRDQAGKEHIAGVMVEVPEVEVPEVEVLVKILPTKLLDKVLQLFTQSVTETTYFRGYSLAEGVKCVLPAGFKLRSLMLESLGYSIPPPPLVFELNGNLVGTFEEMFGELHACEGFPWDLYDYGPEKPIWGSLGKDVVQNLCRSVVLISSFNGNMRCFACTGLLITSQNKKFVLTSASLFHKGDADSEIDASLRIEVFLSREENVLGRLEMYHQGYNIAIVSLITDLGAVFAQDIFKAPKSSKSKEVVAIGRPTKEQEGLLMASKGNLKGNLKCRRNKDHEEFDCEDLKLSTCKIKKVGTGGPLISFEDASFVGMNFHDESGPTPYLPRNKIVKVLKRGFNLLGRSSAIPIMLDIDIGGNAAKKNR